MKKIVSLLLVALFSLSLSAQKIYKGQIKTAEMYSQLAQETFKLTDIQKAKVLQLKKEQFSTMNSQIKPLKDAGKSKEVIAAKNKEINTSYMNKYIEIFDCSKKEYVDFGKKFRAQNKK